jgi:Tol biopolymer transport system component
MSSRSGSWQLYVTDMVGGTPHQLTQAAGNAGLPAWSPDGRQMAFVSDQDGSWGVYVMAATGGQATRIADWEGNREDWLLEHLAWRR